MHGSNDRKTVLVTGSSGRLLLRRHPEVGWHGYEGWLRSQRSRLRSLCSAPEPIAH
jgi:hypothetical protein